MTLQKRNEKWKWKNCAAPSALLISPNLIPASRPAYSLAAFGAFLGLGMCKDLSDALQ
jgi:hypothetical protein